MARPTMYGASCYCGIGGSVSSIFIDAFNRADENLEANADWTRVGGTAGNLAIRTNRVAIIGTTSTLYLCPDIGVANHHAQAELRTVTGIPGGIVVRGVDSNNYVFARYSSVAGGIQLFKNVANTFTLLATGPACIVGDIIRIEAIDDTARVLINGVEGITPTSLAGSHAGVTRAGLVARAATANPWIDNFEAGPL